MLKQTAIEMLGGSNTSAARAIGITPQAVSMWPDVLTRMIEDRVMAASMRMPKVKRAYTKNSCENAKNNAVRLPSVGVNE